MLSNFEFTSLVGVWLNDVRSEVKLASWVDCDAGDRFDKDGFVRFFTM